MSEQLTVDEHLAIIAGRLERLRTADYVDQDTAARLHLLVQADGPWLVAQVQRLLTAQAADHRRIADLQTRLGDAQAKIRRQAGEITRHQAAAGRREVRGTK